MHIAKRLHQKVKILKAFRDKVQGQRSRMVLNFSSQAMEAHTMLLRF